MTADMVTAIEVDRALLEVDGALVEVDGALVEVDTDKYA